MKRLILLIIAGVFLLSCATVPHKIQETKAGDYSYEGMVDPKVVIETWKQIVDKTIQINQNWYEVYYLNPDKNSRIAVVCTLRYVTGFCGAYSYIYDGELHCFIRNQEHCFKHYDWKGYEDQKALLKQRLLDVMDGATI